MRLGGHLQGVAEGVQEGEGGGAGDGEAPAGLSPLLQSPPPELCCQGACAGTQGHVTTTRFPIIPNLEELHSHSPHHLSHGGTLVCEHRKSPQEHFDYLVRMVF